MTINPDHCNPRPDPLTVYKCQDLESADPDDGEDWTTVEADTAEKAAALYCEMRDKRDVQQWGDSPRYQEAGEGSILVRRPDDTRVHVKVRVVKTVDYYGERA